MSAFACIVIFVLLVLFSLCIEKERRSEFNNRFPPLTDAEFLARCKPGVNPVTALKVREIVAEQCGVERSRVYPSARFVEDLGMD
jgi:hypothetical protein